MKRILLSAAVVIAAAAFLLITGAASNQNNVTGTYKIDFDNAFGLVTGADFKVAGVPAGSIKKIDLPQNCVSGNTQACYAQVTVQLKQSGFGPFRSDAFCQSRPQSLIGEYFIECQPGHSGKVIKPGGVIPVTHTESTIPGDLLQDVMRMPYRERFTLIINELGAAVAGRSDDLAAALRRAVPALTQTDNLLNLLANDSHTLQQLTKDSDTVITALANNKTDVTRFVTDANNAATDTAAQQNNLRLTFAKLPAFLEQLKPAMADLDQAATTNIPVLENLTEAANQAAPGGLARFFGDIPPFAHASLPALKSLGRASVTGRQAVIAAKPTVKDLNNFAKHNPELAQNLAIVLRDLDSRSRAVEPDSRSPGGKGYTGLEALLQYVFNQTLAINGFGQFGHYLAVDAFIDPSCAPYATPQSVAKGLQQSGPSYRHCYAWLGPNQPGVNETDPSNPGGCVPDPGGAPPGETGPRTSACKLSPNAASDTNGKASTANAKTASSTASSGSTGTSSGRASPSSGVQQTLSQISAAVGGGGSSGRSGSSAGSGNQTQQLLNYLLAP